MSKHINGTEIIAKLRQAVQCKYIKLIEIMPSLYRLILEKSRSYDSFLQWKI